MRKIMGIYWSVTSAVIILPLLIIYFIGGPTFVQTTTGDVISKSLFVLAVMILYITLRSNLEKIGSIVALLTYLVIITTNYITIDWHYDFIYFVTWILLGIYLSYLSKSVNAVRR